MTELRDLPSVDQVLRQLEPSTLPHSLVVQEIRTVLQQQRESIQSGKAVAFRSVAHEVESRLAALQQPSLRRVINATGVILHTNLGRAPLSHFLPIAGSSNLEFDLTTGQRGKRDVHTAPLLARLLQRAAIVVNNNAAAVFLTLRELAGDGEVLVSRGELIEIGDGFRIPEIMSCSGAQLREIGTTNKTNLDDYRNAITSRTRLILRVHPSNFHISGFTARPKLADLCQLGKERGLPVYEDLGSGCLVDLRRAGVNEPLVADSLAAGVNIVTFSTDKLLGGPQSGIIAGDTELVARIRRNPMYRALRLDKLVIQSLEETLRALLLQQWDRVPALQALFESSEELRRRAEHVASELGHEAREDTAPIGGGSTPDQSLPTWVVRIPADKPQNLLSQLRAATPPVIGRIAAGHVLLDLRSILACEVDELIAAVKAQLHQSE